MQAKKLLKILHTKLKQTYVYRTARELIVYFLYFVIRRRKSEVNCVVFTQGRTGSELLLALIRQHPDIYMDGEIFYYKTIAPHLYLQAQKLLYSRKAYGFKVKAEQLYDVQGLDPKRFITDLYHNGWHIIYLHRRDFFRLAISVLVGRARKKWHSESVEIDKLNKVRIDGMELITLMEKIESDYRLEQDILNKVSYIPVTYEDDLLIEGKHQQTADRIFEALMFDSVPVKAPFSRTSTNKLSETVSNYAEIVAAVRETRFSEYLPERGN